MSVVLKPLFESTVLTTADATYFTAPVPTQVTKATVTNPTGGAATITINLVPSGGAVATGNVLVSARSVQAGETWDITPLVGVILATGDIISAKASANTTLNFAASGVQISG